MVDIVIYINIVIIINIVFIINKKIFRFVI